VFVPSEPVWKNTAKNHVACALCTFRAEMGKSKTTKFKRPQFSAAGLPAREAEEEQPAEESCPAAELLEKVRSS